jgi:hypothetical protein
LFTLRTLDGTGLRPPALAFLVDLFEVLEVAVKDRPILFTGPMVQALLREEDPKWKTRRVMKIQPQLAPNGEFWHWPHLGGLSHWRNGEHVVSGWTTEKMFESCPYGQVGDHLWVRETWTVTDYDWTPESFYTPPNSYLYRATDGETALADAAGHRWRPSIHMPRQASRIKLEITGVRVERLQDISEADAKAEGASPEAEPIYASDDPFDASPPTYGAPTYRYGFRLLWNKINEARGFGWNTNPWVWVLEFKKVVGPTNP